MLAFGKGGTNEPMPTPQFASHHERLLGREFILGATLNRLSARRDSTYQIGCAKIAADKSLVTAGRSIAYHDWGRIKSVADYSPLER